MIFNFYPWRIDVDIEATKQIYIEKEHTMSKELYEKLSEKQKFFFASMGVDIRKIQIEERTHNIPEENEKFYLCTLNFLIFGKFLDIPDYQENLYSDEEVFGNTLPDTLNIIQMPEEQSIPTFDIDGWMCVFKHPYFKFDESRFKKWDCGYILGAILLMK